ncbi:MAG: DinB family protein, partial [Chloroflexota bacterium]
MSYKPEPTMIEFFQYNHWANQELMRICINLSDETITANIPGSHGSIRDTFTHILQAEISFLKPGSKETAMTQKTYTITCIERSAQFIANQ